MGGHSQLEIAVGKDYQVLSFWCFAVRKEGSSITDQSLELNTF